jgi:hypothetical protein
MLPLPPNGTAHAVRCGGSWSFLFMAVLGLAPIFCTGMT